MISWHWHWVQAREHDASSQGVLQARAGACILLPRLSILLQGLEVGPTDVVLHVRPCEGLVRQLDGTVEKRFAKAELRVPLQVTFWVYICDQSMLAHSACRSYPYVCWFPTYWPRIWVSKLRQQVHRAGARQSMRPAAECRGGHP